MLLQSGLRGLCIFKPSCVLLSFLFSLFFFFGGWWWESGRGRRKTRIARELLHKVTRCLWLYHQHVMCFLSRRRWDKMFTALEIKDNQRQLVSFFFVDLQAGTLDRMFPEILWINLPNGGVIIMVHKISRRHNNILIVTVRPRLWGCFSGIPDYPFVF